jgi:phage terminase large subunit GpA-like protein
MLRAAAALPGWGWVATAPENSVVGFHISALYSPWVTWADMVTAWLEAQDDIQSLQAFINTALGEVWEERGDAFRAEGVLARREVYTHPCPEEVAVVTAAVDVQGDRLEALWCGWGRGRELWPLRHEVILGDPAEDPRVPGSVWQRLGPMLAERWDHGSGDGLLTLGAAAVDSGYLPEEVYAFTAPRYGRRVFAVKGASKDVIGKGLVAKRPSNDSKTGARFFNFRPSTAKDTIFAMLRVQTPGPRFVHIPDWFTEDHADQLTAEKLVRTTGRDGSVKRRYVKLRERNEMLDLVVMNLVALSLSGRDPDRPPALIAPAEDAAVVNEGAPAPRPGRVVKMGGRSGPWVAGWGSRD